MDEFETSLIVQGLLEPQLLIEQRQWHALADGVFSSPLYTSGDDKPRAALLHYLPGSTVGTHFHLGYEHILILHGSQIDGDTVYEAGTLVIHKPGTSHTIYSPNGCIALGIWEKPVAFTEQE